ncbi:hypothetical protein P692DRAFT_20341814 [Suillus brevipes Sb2]|nr:hypothetical protein P692DRAFT_20341814 [Suillus brevipes Sb2]
MFHCIQLTSGGGEHMQDLCRVLIAKHNDSLSCAGSEGRMGCLGAKISLWTVPGNPEMRSSIGGWPYIYIISIMSFWMSCKVWRRYTQRTYPAKREIKRVVFDVCEQMISFSS